MTALPRRGAARLTGAAATGFGVLLIGVLASACTSSGAKHTSSGATSPGASVPASASVSTSPTPHPTTYPTLRPETKTPAPQKTKGPVPITRTATFGRSISGSVTGVRSVVGKATQAGETSGPALAVTVDITNGSAKSIDLTDAVVTLAYGPDLTPASSISGPPNHFFSGSVRPGKSASGTYVFTVPKTAQGQRLTISVSYSPVAHAVVFVGRK